MSTEKQVALKSPHIRSGCHRFAFSVWHIAEAIYYRTFVSPQLDSEGVFFIRIFGAFTINAKIPIAISFLLAVKIKDAHTVDGNLQLFNARKSRKFYK